MNTDDEKVLEFLKWWWLHHFLHTLKTTDIYISKGEFYVWITSLEKILIQSGGFRLVDKLWATASTNAYKQESTELCAKCQTLRLPSPILHENTSKTSQNYLKCLHIRDLLKVHENMCYEKLFRSFKRFSH